MVEGREVCIKDRFSVDCVFIGRRSVLLVVGQD